ncbi:MULTISPECIES: glycoside hydrolase family 57 protein [unclassified Candidatus Frackibacter]|uniref:glycoside hydrolase family 57 protein n=1 Tax=unclassified Candidatus Frackibacter TaxID=2648818 RepID=UPI00088C1C77|nr:MULTISPECIES: 1,4-alpha-glucan branching protein domain-containing protein [unclassified Candidatus Frackibacter]SDC34146.1 1,4-alpha-glucan branching enzyme [Candidatus Frackibacter sp. WG11]SEM57088.1 1,4-alpha-glucan branching enzyme [Candidatus Frackibacter sp. WG12]SFL70193.1 1,4-alpha-glucan branching enzyme [Candidatus Frackibacter sp. WG13]
MSKEKGYLSFVLHAHLPFVRHPDYEEFLEERWFYEAITETYIPLINYFERLYKENVDYRLTMSLSPPLISMLTDSLLQQRYIKHLNQLIELSYKELERTQEQPHLNQIAHMYLSKFQQAKETFNKKYNNNLITAFKKFQDLGYLELITCGATHGYLPLMQEYPEAVRAQIELAIKTHKKHLGSKPKGIWLPECGYYPGLDETLKEYDIRFFMLDTHGVLYANPQPKYGAFAPIYTPSGVAAFGRDNESAKQVWSTQEGYPGDYDYREYYRDIGFDLPLDYIKPYIHNNEIRINTGIKYHRITSDECDLENKDFYNPQLASSKAKRHAKDFISKRIGQIEYLDDLIDRKPILVAPYDAELFGHWWYEGPEFLYHAIKSASQEEVIDLISPIDYLEEYPENQVCQPPLCSWGANGYNDVWLDSSNDWIYRHLHQAAEKMTELATDYSAPDSLTKRALNQAARELLLAQSSDWAFIMKTGTMVEYAVKRTKAHINTFFNLYNQVKTDSIDEDWLAKLEAKNNIFPEIDYQVYSR